MDAEQALVKGLQWGLPAAPLTVVILFLVTWTPSSASGDRSYWLYMVCMAGAAVGFAGAVWARRWGGRHRALYSVALAAVLEVAWILLVVAARSAMPAMTEAGAMLAAASVSSLILLWLLEASEDIRCQLIGYVVALLAGFILYALVTLAPYSGWLTFGLPFLTGLLLAYHFYKTPSLRPEAIAPIDGLREGSLIRWGLAVGLEAFLLGGCLGVVGFEAPRVDSSIMVAGVAMGGLLLLRTGWERATSGLVLPFVVSGLCAGLTAFSGVSFSLFLGGCVCMMAWAAMERRAACPLGEGVCLGVALGLVDLCAMAGLSVVYFLVREGALDQMLATLALVVGLVVADGIRRLVCGGTGTGVVAADRQGALTAEGVARLGERYGLSQRELEVAELVCQSRGVRFISQKLGVAPSTVKSHIQHVYVKTGVHSRDELQVLAERLEGGRTE